MARSSAQPTAGRSATWSATAPTSAAGLRWPATAKLCRAASGTRPYCPNRTSLRSWPRSREADMDDELLLGGEIFESRLLLGTGGVPSLDVLERAIVGSGTQLVTIALRRVEASMNGPLLDVLDRCNGRLLPNTAGCMTAREAVVTAKLA